jgi:nicotinamidase-related amidase
MVQTFGEIRTALTRLEALVQDYLALVRVGTIALDVRDVGAALQAWTAELQPDAEDSFVLKSKHAGLYATTLDLLFQALGVHTLMLTGIAGNICVLLTANDAYMRGYRLISPADGVASQTVREHASALHVM